MDNRVPKDAEPATMNDPALDALMWPMNTGEIVWPSAGRTLFLRARVGAALLARPRESMVCEQTFKPEALRLAQAGFARTALPDERFALVMILPPRSRDEGRVLFAQALQRADPGATVIASVENNQGARSAEEDLARLAGPITTRSKHKCRVFHLCKDAGTIDAELLASWMALDAPRTIDDTGLLGRVGVFSADAIDPASRLLAEHLPGDLAGRAADLGAGGGYLALELAKRNPGITSIDLYDAEARALDVARLNLASLSQTRAIGYHWHDVSTGLPSRYDAIVSNPPFHQGRADSPDLGRAFIIAAANALDHGGRLWLVANRHLPYESVLAEHFAQVRVVVVRDGFKVIAARRAS